ncbi:MAG: zinc ribbon domain-containing protein [Bacteroidota bacterium]
MPTYVYRRPDGTTFEVFQKISAPALTEDPETGVPVERVISGGAGLQFKGDGFYLTDYARKGDGSSSTPSESGSSSESASSDTASSSSSGDGSSGTTTSASGDDSD